MAYLYEACDQISDFCHQQLPRKMCRKISWTDGRTDGRTDGQMDRGKTVYPPSLPSGSGGIIIDIVYGVCRIVIKSVQQCTYFLFFVNLLLVSILKYSSTNKMNCELMLTYDTPALRQTGSRNLTGQKTLPMIWGSYIKHVTKYQISAINSC